MTTTESRNGELVTVAIITYQTGRLAYHFKGKTLGGSFDLEGQLPKPQPVPVLDKQAPANAQPNAGGGRLRIEGTELEWLWDSLGIRDSLGLLHGRVDLVLDFHQKDWEQSPTGMGLFRIHRLRWKDVELAGELAGEARLTAGELRLDRLSGMFAEGELNGQIALHLKEFNRSWFNLSLQGVSTARLLTPWPSLATVVQGPVDLSLRGRVGQAWTGTGVVTLARGKVLGIDVLDWRLPWSFEFVPAQGRAVVEIADSIAHVAQGRATLRASLYLGVEPRLEGQIRFFDVDLATLLRNFSDQSELGSGRGAGRIDFGGDNVRSLNELAANVDASFQQARALDFPIIKQLVPFFGIGRASATFQSGDLRGRLAGGVFRIQHFGLTGNLLKLLIEGSVNLQGRLNLEATASTGSIGVSLNAGSARNPQPEGMKKG